MNYLSRVNKKRHVLALKKSLASIFLSILCMMLIIVTGNLAVAQNTQIQNSGDGVHLEETQGVGHASQQPGQAQEPPQSIGDIEETEISYFDPETIPESVPTPDADFVFEVPVNVQSIHANIEKISIICRLVDQDLKERGIASKQMELVNGAFNGTVTVGVNVKDVPKNTIKLYYCFMKLKRKVGAPTWDTPYPSSVMAGMRQLPTEGPIDTRAHPDKPFTKDTQKDIPSYARY